MTFVIEKDVRLMLSISLTIDIPSSYGEQQQDKNVIYNDRMLNIEFEIFRNSIVIIQRKIGKLKIMDRFDIIRF